MEDAEMALEVEQYLIQKFKDDLQKYPRLPLHRDLDELGNSAERILQSSPDGSSLRETLYKLNSVLDDCKAKSGKHVLPDLVNPFLQNIKQELKDIGASLKKLEQSNGHLSTNPNQPRTNNVRPTSADAGQVSRSNPAFSDQSKKSKVHGFDDDVIELEKLLLKQESSADKFKAIGVVGKSGFGKTTLCQEILVKMKDHFFVPRILVSFSKESNQDVHPRIRIATRILDALGVEEERVDSISKDHGLAGLICAIYFQLNGKKYLIVLDDAADSDEWFRQLDSSLPRDCKWEERLAYAFPKGDGGRVVVASRHEEVIKKIVGEENIHQLLPRPDPDSIWNIFVDAAEKDGEEFSPPNAEDLKKEITKKCAGNPSTAKTLGQAWKEKNLVSTVNDDGSGTGTGTGTAADINLQSQQFSDGGPSV